MTNFEIIAEVAETMEFDYDGSNLKTFAEWKKLGYQVKKGETAFLKANIWRKSTKKEEIKNEETGEVEVVEKGKFYKKLSFFFTEDQVKKATKKTK
jgi:hypothetical protein